MKKSLTTEERKELSKLDRSFRYHVIKGSRLWKYFSPFKVNDLLKIYWHISYSKFLLRLIFLRHFILKTLAMLFEPKSIIPLFFLMSVFITLSLTFRMIIGF